MFVPFSSLRTLDSLSTYLRILSLNIAFQCLLQWPKQEWVKIRVKLFSVQFNSVAQSCLILCNPMNCSTPGLPVHHQLPEFTQTHVHRVGDAIQPSHPLSSPSPPAPNPSQHQGLFQWVNLFAWGFRIYQNLVCLMSSGASKRITGSQGMMKWHSSFISDDLFKDR